MPRKYKIAVIDDEIIQDESRKSVYNKLFTEDHFDVIYIDKEKDVISIEELIVDGYIIDINLGKWSMYRSFDKVLPLIKDKGPVFLVSSKWKDYNSQELMDILNSTINNPVKSFFALNEFYDRKSGTAPNEEVFTTIRMKILTDLHSYYRRSPFRPGANDDLNILHISDTQFGDPSTDTGSSLSEVAIAKYLRKNSIQLHFMIVSGDIAYSGISSEYSIAYRWFNKITELIWPDKYINDRILIVPGNHDINYKICATDNYNFNLKTNKLDYNIKGGKANEQSEYALAPFRKFAHSITGDDEWLKNTNKLCWVNEKFLNIGLRFYHLNSLSEVDSNNIDLIKINESILNNIIRTDNAEVFNIAISHHGMAIDTIKGFNNWENIRNFNDIGNINLFVHGHGHGWAATLDPQDNNSSPKMYMIMAPTTHLNGKKRKDPRGFNLITLKRREERIEKVISQLYEMRGANIEKAANRMLEWNLKK